MVMRKSSCAVSRCGVVVTLILQILHRDLDIDLALRAEIESAEGSDAEADDVAEGEASGADYRLGVVFAFGFVVDDLEVESGVIDGGGDRNLKSFVPGGRGVAVVVDFGGELNGGFDPSRDGWLQ